MKKRLSFLYVVFVLFNLSACKSAPTAPAPPDPVLVYYTVQIIYIRPAGSILRSERIEDGFPAPISHNCWDPIDFHLVKIDNYRYESELQPIPDNEGRSLYDLWLVDPARWDGVHEDTGVVGDIFKIRVKETGVEKQLLNIKKNILMCNPYKGPNARMAYFRLMKNGTIQDE